MIRLVSVSKSFSRRSALRDVSLRVRAGEVFGLLGHTGAGKSTAVGILLGQVHPDSGEAWIGAHPVRRDRRRALAAVGATFEAPGFYDYLSGWTNLSLLARYSGVTDARRISAAAERVGLARRVRDPVRTYSRGMRQQLALASAIAHGPSVLILDEPMDGLDIEGTHAVRDLLLELNEREGVTVLLTSNRLHQVERLCHRVAILRQGRVVFEGAWEEVAGTERPIRVEMEDWERAGPILERHRLRRVAEDRLLGPRDVDAAEVLAALAACGARVRAFEPQRLTLEDFYLNTVSAGS